MRPGIMKREGLVRWLKRLGFWGFLFFLAKGVLWLVFIFWIAKK